VEESKRATPENTRWIEYGITESAEAGAQLRSSSLPREQAKALVHHINKTNPNIGATSHPLNTKVGAEHQVHIKNASEFIKSFPVADVALKSHADSHFRYGPKASAHTQPSMHCR